jgi:hypothetical protein
MIAETSRSRLIWYQLVDGSTGQLYKNTTSDKVSVSRDADVADFRDAVKVKWDEPGYLNGIPAGILIVFKNKTAFEIGMLNMKATTGGWKKTLSLATWESQRRKL